MNYEDMTDFEINKAVCATKGVKIDDEQYEYLCDRDERIVLCRDELGMSIGVDYCNDPSDAWSIIQSFGISLVFMGNYWEAHALINEDEAHNTKNENPLRAAMIVYLKTKAAI